MTQYTDEELAAILTYVESDRTERKRVWSREVGKKARQAVCAFANDLPNSGEAGVLIFGANDDGTPNHDFIVDDQLLLTISEMRTDGQIVPPPSISVQAREINNFTYVVVIVEPSDSPPVRYDGRIWVRIGPRRSIATAQDERILIEKRQHGDRPADLRPIQSTKWEDINLTRFTLEYLPSAFAKTVLEANERTDLQRLMSLKLVTGASPHPCTLTGCLALVDDATWHVPGAYIQWLRIRGTSLADPKIDEERGTGHLEKSIATVEAKLNAYLTTEVDYGTTTKERRFSPYPIEALKELLRNAVMHRNYYGTNAPVHVYWYDDRIEISNPGGPYGEVTTENFGTPGLRDYRNPNIAEAMKVLGLVQQFGSGIQISQQLCAKNSNPPIEFKLSQNFVTAIIRPAQKPW